MKLNLVRLRIEQKNGGSPFPAFPPAQTATGTETANIDAAVPTVPSVPSPELACELPEPLQDHLSWADDFGRWVLARCFLHERSFGGVKSLHADFWDWCIGQQTVACNLPTFEVLLASQNFLLGGGLVAGLILREDWESCFLPHQPRSASSAADVESVSNPTLVHRGDLLREKEA